jgi:hypothetical protein
MRVFLVLRTLTGHNMARGIESFCPPDLRNVPAHCYVRKHCGEKEDSRLHRYIINAPQPLLVLTNKFDYMK